MQPALSPPSLVRFGVFELDRRSGELRKAGARITLQDQPLEILKALVERPGELVTRDELRRRLWPADTFVDFEHGLNAAVKRLRDALGDSAESPRYVETIPRRGYRFLLPVDAREHPCAVDAVTTKAERSRVRRAVWLATAAVAIVGIAAALRLRSGRESLADRGAAEPKMTLLTFDSGLTAFPTLSADAQILAYASDRAGEENLDIWMQPVKSGGPVRLTSHPADDDQPSLSPDGTRLAFHSERDGGGIYVMPAHSGGEPTPIAHGANGPRFSPDGRWIAYTVGANPQRGGDPQAMGLNSIGIVPSGGGEATRIVPEFSSAAFPIWSPDNRRLLFWGQRTGEGQGDWWIAPIDGGAAVRTGALERLTRQEIQCHPNAGAWIPGNRILFQARRGTFADVWELSLAPDTWEASGTVRRLTTGASYHLEPFAAGNLVVFAGYTFDFNIWSLPMATNDGRAAGPLTRLTDTATLKFEPSVSADASILTYYTVKQDGGEIWTRDLRTAVETRIVPPSEECAGCALRADGARVACGGRDGVIESIPAHGGPGERLCSDCAWAVPQDWSRDGRWLLMGDVRGGGRRVAVMNLASGRIDGALQHDRHPLYQPRFSNDSRWMTFMEVTGMERTRLWAAPFNGGAVPQREWVALTSGDWFDDKPRLSPDDALLYFVSNRDGFRCIWAQRLDPATKRPVGDPFAVHHSHSTRMAIGRISSSVQELSVARDQLVFNMGGITANIWSLPLDAGSK